MSSARIYRPSREPSQSGMARTKQWVLMFDPTAAPQTEPLMGWVSSTDTLQQVRLEFDTKEEAIAYAARAGIAYRVEEPRPQTVRRGLSYSDNFKFNRAAPWTH